MVDAPRVPMDVAVSLASTSQVTLVVLQLAVKDVKVARSMMRILTERGLPAARIMPLVNRYRKHRSTISMQEAEAALGGVSLRPIRNDFRGARRAIDFGQPLSQAAPRSALRRDLRRLAAELIEAHSQGTPVAGSR